MNCPQKRAFNSFPPSGKMLHCDELKYKGNPNFAKKQPNRDGGMYAAARMRFTCLSAKVRKSSIHKGLGADGEFYTFADLCRLSDRNVSRFITLFSTVLPIRQVIHIQTAAGAGADTLRHSMNAVSDQYKQADAIRVARQLSEADRLLGVEFAPLGLPQPKVSAAGAAAAANSIVNEIQRLSAPQDAAGPIRPSPTAASDRSAALAALLGRHDSSCPHCTCVTGHTRTVFGEGACDAELMFIGEAPGEEEDRTGRPFVGRAGQKLDEIIRAIGMRREDVYIANVLKARPPQNRTPLPHEVEACAPFLAEQIRIIHPKVIVALGGPAAKWLLKTDVGITRLRGVFAWYEDHDLRIPVMPTFHPAYLLRNYTTETRKQVWSDMQAAKQRLQEPRDE